MTPQPLKFPTSKIQPPQSATEVSLTALCASYAEMGQAIADASTVAEAYALYRYLASMERSLMELTTQAMRRCEQLEMEAGVGLSK
jgi:hypothetical protein